jgi:hypothetical protein
LEKFFGAADLLPEKPATVSGRRCNEMETQRLARMRVKLPGCMLRTATITWLAVIACNSAAGFPCPPRQPASRPVARGLQTVWKNACAAGSQPSFRTPHSSFLWKSS